MIVKQQDRQWIFFLCFIGIILYWNSLHTPFLWDENELIVNDPRVHNWSRIPEIFRTPFFPAKTAFKLYYRPLSTLSFSLDYHLWGFNPLGYHITNLFFHLANTLLVYFLYKRFLKQETLAFLGAFLFLAHPAHVEAVTYIPSRTDVLSLFFFLASFYTYLIGRNSKKKAWCYLLCALCYGLALLSKERATFLPLLIISHMLLIDRKKNPLRREEGLLLLGFFLFFAAWAYIRQFISVRLPLQTLLDLSRLPLRLFVLPEILGSYIRIWFFPLPLYMGRVIPIEILRANTLLLEWIALLLTLASLCLLFRKKEERFWLIWIAVSLLPVIQIFPIYMNSKHLYLALSEYLLYYASIGIIGLLATRWGSLFVGPKKSQFIPLFLLGAVLTCFSFQVIWRNGEYRSRIVFFEQTVRHAPWHSVAYSELGLAYREAGYSKEAEEAFQKSLSLAPTDKRVYVNLGVLALERGDLNQAARFYQEAFKLAPRDSIVLHNLGTIERRRGRLREAVHFFEEAVKADFYPNMHTYGEMSHTYWDLGEKEKALETVKEGLRIDSTNLELKEIKHRIEEQLRKGQKKESSLQKI